MPDEWTIANEFAAVAVSVDDAGQDKRLAVRDLDTGAAILLDAIVLANLTRLSEAALRAIMTPDAGADD